VPSYKIQEYKDKQTNSQ